MISFTCSNCSRAYSVKDRLAGKTSKCLKCDAPITVPTPATETDSEPVKAFLVADAETAQPSDPMAKPDQAGETVIPSLPELQGFLFDKARSLQKTDHIKLAIGLGVTALMAFSLYAYPVCMLLFGLVSLGFSVFFVYRAVTANRPSSVETESRKLNRGRTRATTENGPSSEKIESPKLNLVRVFATVVAVSVVCLGSLYIVSRVGGIFTGQYASLIRSSENSPSTTSPSTYSSLSDSSSSTKSTNTVQEKQTIGKKTVGYSIEEAKKETKKAEDLKNSFVVNLNATSLPKYFEGHDIKTLCQRLRRGYDSDDEFRTKEKKKQLDQQHVAKMKLGSNGVSSYFVFSIRDNYPRYDAEQKGFFDQFFREHKEIEKEYETRREFVGSNAFGATVKASETDVTEYGLKFSKDSLSTKFPCTVEVAKRVKAKNKLRIALICKLRDPYVEYDSERGGRPTITNPNVRDTTIISVLATLKEIWFYDYESGEIYHRQKTDFFR